MAFKISEVCRKRGKRKRRSEDKGYGNDTHLCQCGRSRRPLAVNVKEAARQNCSEISEECDLDELQELEEEEEEGEVSRLSEGNTELTKKFSWHFGLFLYMNPFMNLHVGIKIHQCVCLSRSVHLSLSHNNGGLSVSPGISLCTQSPPVLLKYHTCDHMTHHMTSCDRV